MEIKPLPPLNSAAFVRLLIEDMRKTADARDMVLYMGSWAEVTQLDQFFGQWAMPQGKAPVACLACAGGSVVIHGMGGSKDDQQWTPEQYKVADFCDNLRSGYFTMCEQQGFPIPEEVWPSYQRGMSDEIAETFWQDWDNFLKAYEEYELEHPNEDALVTTS